MTVKNQDKAHTTSFKYFSYRAQSIQSPLHPPITKDIKSMAMCCHFSLHSWLYIEGYAAVMTLSDGVVFWVNHCVILPGAMEVQSAAAYS